MEQLGWEYPDAWCFIPTGGGGHDRRAWKAFLEMEELGWVTGSPKMIAVQAAGCAPVVRAFEQGEAAASMWQMRGHRVLLGLRVPSSRGDYIDFDILRQSGGTAGALSDESIFVPLKDWPATGRVAARLSSGGDSGLRSPD